MIGDESSILIYSYPIFTYIHRSEWESYTSEIDLSYPCATSSLEESCSRIVSYMYEVYISHIVTPACTGESTFTNQNIESFTTNEVNLMSCSTGETDPSYT